LQVLAQSLELFFSLVVRQAGLHHLEAMRALGRWVGESVLGKMMKSPAQDGEYSSFFGELVLYAIEK